MSLSSFISFYTRPSDSELLQHYTGAPRSSWGPSWCQQSCGDEDLLMESDSASGSLLAESKSVEVWIFLWWILTCITLALHADKNVPNLTFRVLCLILIWRIFIMFYFFWCLLLILIWIQVYSSPCSLLAHILFAVHLISEWNKK